MSDVAVEAAIRDGRIPASARRAYDIEMAKRPKATRRLLATLAPALTPPAQQGEEDVASDTPDEAYPTVALSRREREAIQARGRGHAPVHDASASASLAPPPVAAQALDSSEEAYPREWLTEKERSGPTSGRVTVAND